MPAMIYDNVIGTGTTLRQCTSARYSSGMQLAIDRASGSPLPSQVRQARAEPVCSFTSSDLSTATTAIGLNYGLCLSSSTLSMWLAAQGCSGATGTGTHTRITGAKGFCHISSISARQSDQMATVNIECCWLSSDGFTTPITITHNNDLSATSFVDTYRMGAVLLDGTALTGVTGITINPGTNYQKLYQDGGVYPTQTVLGEITPSIDLTFLNQAYASAFGTAVNSNSLIKTATNLSCRFHINQDGGSVDTATYITVAAADGYAHVEEVTASDRNVAEVTVRVTGLSLAVS